MRGADRSRPRSVVLSHGLFLTRRLFDAPVAALADRCRRVAYDHRGQGASQSAAAQLDSTVPCCHPKREPLQCWLGPRSRRLSGGIRVKGIARQVRSATEGQKTVLRFRLETPEGRSAPVELRGAEIRGDIGEGDTVELSVPATAQGHVVRLSQVMNLTTNCIVEAWNPSVLYQARNLVAKEALSAVVGAGATMAVGGLLRVGQSKPATSSPATTSVPAATSSPPPTSGPSTSATSTTRVYPAPPSAPSSDLYGIPIGLTVLAFAIYVAVRVRRRRQRHESLLPLLLALGIGLFLALLLLSLLSA